MQITPLSTQPNSVTRPATFDADSDKFHEELPVAFTELNAMFLAMAALAAGGAVSLKYTFSATTTDADPGAGILRLDNATQNAATVIRIDLTDNAGSDMTNVLALLDDSTSTSKGMLTLRHTTDATKWLTFKVASMVSPSGYRNVTVTNPVGSSATPFTAGDSILVDFTATGDKGDKGDTGNVALIGNATGAINTARATVASHATTADIWGAAGNQIDWTGTATTTIFPNAPQAGAERTLICAGACSFTAGANMLIDGVASAATVTCAANDQVIVKAISTTQFKLSRIKYDGTAQVSAGGLTVGTPVATTSGTSITLGNIPAGVKMLALSFNEVSVNAGTNMLIQLGDSGGVETTGYVSVATKLSGGSAVSGATSTAGFILNDGAAATLSGTIFFNLSNAAAFTWTATGGVGNSFVVLTSGRKALSSELISLTLTTSAGNISFNSGSITLSYI